MNAKKLEIYIAGPDVFELNAKEIGQKYSALCEKNGFTGLYPLDNEIDVSTPQQMAKNIFVANKNMIDRCDIVIANLNSFRGKEPDSGTVWEVGYAVALGKKVYGYMSNTASYASRFKNKEKSHIDGILVDNTQLIIEDFDLPINLMLACSIQIIKGDFKQALDFIAQDINTRPL